MALSWRHLACWVLIGSLSGCAYAGPLVETMATARTAQLQAQNGSTEQVVYLFGGVDHKTFLGCLCNASAPNSLLNQSAAFGSSYSTTSIANHLSQFGSAFSNYSACSLYATDPPVFVTSGGAFIGRLTLNQSVVGAITEPKVLDWLRGVCSG